MILITFTKNSLNYKYSNEIFSSELLRKDGSTSLLKNFPNFLKLKKSHDDCQQDLYTAVLCRPKEEDKDDHIILTLTDNTEVKVDPEPLLSCVRGSRVFIRDIKTIKAELGDVEEWIWDVFSILSSGGAVIQEIQCSFVAVYSPTIHEMIQEGKLLKFR